MIIVNIIKGVVSASRCNCCTKDKKKYYTYAMTKSRLLLKKEKSKINCNVKSNFYIFCSTCFMLAKLILLCNEFIDNVLNEIGFPTKLINVIMQADRRKTGERLVVTCTGAFELLKGYIT